MCLRNMKAKIVSVLKKKILLNLLPRLASSRSSDISARGRGAPSRPGRCSCNKHHWFQESWSSYRLNVPEPHGAFRRLNKLILKCTFWEPHFAN